MFEVLTLGAISAQGTAKLNGFRVGSDILDPDGIIVRSQQIDGEFLRRMQRLGIIVRAGIGVNTIDVEEATKLGIVIENTPGGNKIAVAELVRTMLGALARNIPAALNYLKGFRGKLLTEKEFSDLIDKEKKRFQGIELAGKTFGVVGLGAIGVEVANNALGKGMRVIGFDSALSIENAHRLSIDVARVQTLKALLAQADIVTLHIPLIEGEGGTRHYISWEQIRRMKPGAILMNFARGPVCDENAVLAALDGEVLGAYITDFPTVALINREHPKVICTPHLGATTIESEENCATMAAEQTSRFLKYGEVVNSVNFKTVEMALDPSTAARVIVVNKNVPGMIATISQALSRRGVNVLDMRDASRGPVGYNLIDCQSAVPQGVVEEIGSMEGIIRVRLITF